MDWNQRYTFNFPTPIRFGLGVIDELGPHLKGQGFKKPLIVTDPGLAGLPLFKKIVASLQASGLGVEVYHGIHKNPVKSDVLGGVEQFKKSSCDSVVGIGGGASLDVARAIVLKAHHARDLFDYEDSTGGERLVTGEIPYFITVPTTSGTGSEVGRSTVISDDTTHEKKILFSPRLMARQVFADPGLTFELPAAVTAATGMDALTHNIESYLAKGFHPICDGVALEGIRLIGQSFVRAVNKPDLESRSQMMIAALMGAIAFQKGLGVVHSTAHPLSTLFDLHHGLANAIMLRHGVAFNADCSADRLKNIAAILNLSNPGPEALIQYLGRLNEEIHLPLRLSTQGVAEKDLEKLARLAFQDVCHQCNPKPVIEADFKKIYSAAL
ncbi:MAG: iron-containing alcohol dehydrogenase [Deltaproteobacteria bacterium]|nr:iron-containing alcohol dehydrogenase [Deltaproteobacteria bacterium]